MNAADDWKCTPLHRSCHSGDVEIAALLVKHGASLSTRDDQMERPGQRFADGISAERREVCSSVHTTHVGINTYHGYTTGSSTRVDAEVYRGCMPRRVSKDASARYLDIHRENRKLVSRILLRAHW